MIDRRRLGKVGLAAFILVGYYGFVRYTGTGIPCLFRFVFHLKCPGCGITHMLLALGKGDLSGAFHSHPVIFCFGPFLLWLLINPLETIYFPGKRSGKNGNPPGCWYSWPLC